MMIKSRKTWRRRRLSFHSMSQILDDAERICRAGGVQSDGNWTPGQAFEHLAKSIHSSAHNSKAILPGWRRLLAKLGKPFLLRYGLPAGVRIESINAIAALEFLPSNDISDGDGLLLLRAAINGISKSAMTARHNLFGKMSSREWEMMHCRHAELHLGFFILQE